MLCTGSVHFALWWFTFPQQDVNIFDMYVIMHDRVDSSQRDTVVQILNHAFHWYQIPYHPNLLTNGSKIGCKCNVSDKIFKLTVQDLHTNNSMKRSWNHLTQIHVFRKKSISNNLN